MRASCVVTSEGVVIDTYNKPNVFKIRNTQHRIAELDEFTETFASSLNDNGFIATKSSFIYAFQPFYTDDKVYMFYKTSLDASNPLVRQAFNYKSGRQAGIRQEDIPTLNSIFYDDSNGRTNWYILQAQEFILERNIYDCQWESIIPQKPILYIDFIQATKTNTLTKEEVGKGMGTRAYYYPQDKAIYDANVIIKAALSLSDGNVQMAYDAVRKHYSFDTKKPYGNQALLCLYAINDLPFSGKIYPLYLEVREAIKEVLPFSYSIRYNGNVINFGYQQKFHNLYVCDTLTNPNKYTMILNGNVINNISELKTNLKSFIEPCKWFDDVVLPHTIYGKDNCYDYRNEHNQSERNSKY